MPMTPIETALRVAANYPLQGPPKQVQPLGNAGGFSGSQIWRVITAEGDLCLRRWPASQRRDRLAYIHMTLFRAVAAGFPKLPAPLLTRDGNSWVAESGHLWELAPWLAGAADYHQRPSPARLAAALQTLAKFHDAAFDRREAAHAPAPGLERRLALLDDYRGSTRGEIEQKLPAVGGGDLCALADRILPRFDRLAQPVRASLQHHLHRPVAVQACIRDIWSDHVLFVEDAVSGIIDFGALNRDGVEVDVARLLGSLAADNQQDWQTGLQAYRQVRRLSSEQESLVRALDRANVVLSGMNWLKWLALEGRRFEDRSSVLARLQQIAFRLESLPG
jgi:Ser/Thr protein kinase RdoA (MazF antagonist)